MPVSKAKRRTNDKYNAEKCSQIAIRPLKADAAAIRAAAAEAGQSLQGYIVQACRERMQRDAETAEQSAQHSIEDSSADDDA